MKILEERLPISIEVDCLTGLTLQAYNGPSPSILNISMNVLEGSIQRGGIAGVRVDLPVAPPGQGTSFPQLTSYFFYQAGTSVS